MKREGERGAIILEATYCVAIVIIIAVFMISMAFYLYQNAMVKIVANEVAEEVVHIYKYQNADSSSSISRDDVINTMRYRYLLFDGILRVKCRIKMYQYTANRLGTTSMAVKKAGPMCEIESRADDIGRRHYTVTIKQKYKFLLGGLLELFGIKGERVISAEARVVDIDMLSYINTVKTTKYGISKVQKNSEALKLINNVIELIASVMS